MGSPIRPEPDPIEAYKQKYLRAQSPDATAADPVAAYKQQYGGQPVEYGKGLATSVAQGATFGLADEILGGIDAANSLLPRSLGGEGGSLKNLGAKYRSTRDQIRSTESTFAAANHKTHIAANIAGGLVNAPLFAGGPARTLLARIGQGIDAGAVGGATAGFGASDKPTFGEQVEDAARGAMGGAVIGGVLPVAGRIAGSVGGKLLDATGARPASYANTPTIGGQARRLFDPLLRDPSETLGVGPPPGPVLPPEMRGEGMTALASRRVMGGTSIPPQGGILRSAARAAGVESIEQRALGMIQRAMDRDGVSLEEASRKAAGAFSLEPNTLMELAGRNMKRLGRSALTSPGKGSDVMASTLENRAMGEEDRSIRNLLSASGIGGRTNTFQTAEDLIASRAQQAKPLYEQAYARGPISDASRAEFEKLLQTREFREAWNEARALANDEGHSIPKIRRVKGGEAGQDATAQQADAMMHYHAAKNALDAEMAYNPNSPKAAELREAFSDATKNLSGATKNRYEFVKTPDVRSVDYMKQVVDDVIKGKMASGPGAGGLSRARGSMLLKKKDAFLSQIDAEVPEYGAARGQYAGDSRLLDALENGRSIFKMHPDEAKAVVDGMTDGERELFKKGALEAFADKIESTPPGNNVNRRVFDKTLDQKRLALLFKSDADKQAFGEQTARAAQRFKTRNFLGAQSATADKLAELGELAGVSLDDVVDAATGNAHGLLRRTAAKLARKGEAGLSEKTADVVADRLTAGARPHTSVEGVLTELKRHQAEMATRQANRPGFIGATAASAPQQKSRKQ